MKTSVWENFEIEPFLEYLRISKGYNIGIYEHQIAQQLMLKLAESKNLPTTEEELVDFLMPILCKNSPQQYSFREDFREWTSIKPKDTQQIENELEELGKTEKLKNTLKKALILLGSLIGVTLMVIAILVNPVNNEGGNNGNVNIPIPIYSFRFYAVIFFSAFAIAIIIVLINYFRALKAQKKDIDTYLNKRSINPDQAFYLNQLFSPELCQNFFLSQDLIQTAKKYNNPLKGESLEIDLEQTIQTVLNAGGYLQVIKKKVPRSPEYLILIDRKTYIDHQSKYIETLIDVLESFNVPMDVFYFSGDPRNSYSEREEKTYNLAQLAQKFPNHNLLMFSAIKEFFNPISLELKSWTQELYPWNAKALFTLDNPSANTILFDLVAELIEWHPISPEGLEEYILSNSKLSIEEDQSLPVLFQKNHLDWLEQQDHSNLDKKWIINELSNYLGEQGFKWLTTTAIYPEVNLNFTLYLGNTLSDASGTPFYTQSSFLKLIQLPWFRFGRMPDWLRMQLISEMPKSLEKEVRNAIFALFSVALKEPLSTFSLEYGSFVNETNTKLHKQLLKSLRQIYKNDSFLNDFIFEGFMEDTLSIKVPKLNEPKEESIPQKIDLNRSTHFLKQPKGFYTLFFTEMWERFSYYGMRSILILFMTATIAEKGLGIDPQNAGAIYGLYTAGVYLLTLPGGWLADNILGQRKAIWYGGILIMIGHLILAIPGSTSIFIIGLVFVATGTGLLKPNISTLVGDLYPEGGAHRDQGFSIFYMGLNLGSFLGQILVPLLASYNWKWGFGAAAIGMFFGLLQFRLTKGKLNDLGLKPKLDEETEKGKVVSEANTVLVGILALTLVGFFTFLQYFKVIDVTTVDGIAQAVGIIIVIVSLFYFLYIMVAGGLDQVELKKILVIFCLFIGAALFWSGFEQAGSSLNLFARDFTNRMIGNWEVPAGMLQSINSLFIIILAPIVGWLWIKLAARNLNPNTPIKFGVGIILMGLGFLVMYFAAQIAATGTKAGMSWLYFSYFLYTIAELFLSPIGISATTKLSPKRYVGQMMGIWFVGASLGNLIAGLFAGGGVDVENPSQMPALFLSVAIFGVVTGGGFLLFTPVLKKWMGNVN